MKVTLIAKVLALFSTLTLTSGAPTASPAVATGLVPGVASFKLKADSSAPEGLRGQTVTWDGVLDGNLGFGQGAEQLSAFIQFNSTEGIAFYARNTALEIYLRPTHGTPAYFAKLGNPLNDATPALILFKKFSIAAWAVNPGEVHYRFGYNGNYGQWAACGGPTNYTLYYGAVGVPASGCTANFGLDLFYE